MIESLDLQTRGDRVVVLGAAESLLAALCGAPRGAAVGEPDDLARVVGGSLQVLGRDVASGAHREVMGFAPLDPPLPGSWSVEDYLGWGLRLGGVPRRRAGALALAALERSLGSPGVTLAMIEHDGDLRKLRARPDFSKWFEQMKTRRAPKAGGGEKGEEENPPPGSDSR